MYRDFRMFKLAAFTVSLFVLVAGCGKESTEQTVDSGTVSVEIAEQTPVEGWLDVILPSAPVAMDACGENLWILTADGFVMRWNSTGGEWSAVETDTPLAATDIAFAVSASESGAAILSPEALIILSGDQVAEVVFPDGITPAGVCVMDENAAVLFNDGSVSISSESSSELIRIVESAEKTVAGSFCYDQDALAWMNTDGTASRFDVTESLLSEMILPDSTTSIHLSNGELLACDGFVVYRLCGADGWEECFSGTIIGENLLYTERGIADLDSDDYVVTAGLPQHPEKACQLDDGTVWSISNGGIVVWAEIGSVETRLPEADVQMLRYRMAGQTGGGSANGSGVVDADVSFGGLFRIYESVSSRPDPFSEFPLTSRDLRRSIEDLSIEELHLVGITLDPSGGDQAMVEDANGVAYVLREGTVLRNNTHIAEITGNEVIVVQEVTVGSEDGPGGTTSIPTIFSMRLHEEGGL
ncbi:MAG: hypothetical protein K8S62_09370 [Candidatus Sabulitectum sp.]|nr:hypothetical protein [Candidatus Sabulitectum sp.]